MGAALALGQRPARAQNYPARPVTVICPWGAGGGTDATARIVAAVLEKELKQPFNVVNRTGGSGVVGHAAIARRAAGRLHDRHHHRRDLDDALAGADRVQARQLYAARADERGPAGHSGQRDSPYKTVKELADAIKAAPPGKLKASGTGQGGIWHLALVGWLTAMGLKPDHVAWVPMNGAAPAMQDLASGGLDLVTCSVPEARAMIEAGKARSLAIMAAERNPGLQGRADAEGGHGHRLHHRRLARLCRRRRVCRPMSRPRLPPR